MSFRVPSLLGATVSLLLATSAPAQSAVRTLLALSKTDHVLAIIDPDTLKVLRRVPVGPDPHEVVASADGKVAYVSNMGDDNLHEIDVIDLTTATARPPFDTGAMLGPHGLAFVGGKLWFTAQGSKAIGRYDPASGRIDTVVGTGQDRTHMIAVTPDQTRFYASNVLSGSISIFDYVTLPPIVSPVGYVRPGAKPYSGWEQTSIPFAKGNEGFAVSPDGRELWTATPFGGQVGIIDTVGKTLVATIDAHVEGANRLAFTPDGRRVLISSLKTGNLTIFDVASRRAVKTLNLGTGAAGMLVTADGSRAFISCTSDGYVAVVDLDTLAVVGRISFGGQPDGLGWADR